MLGGLAVPGPDDRTTLAVDAVRERHPLIVGGARQHLAQGERDALERVVVVVQDDDVPRRPEPGSRPSPRPLPSEA